MKNFSIVFESIDELKKTVSLKGVVDSSRLLIQVFCATANQNFIIKMEDYFRLKFPNATFMGTTTDGVIMDTEVYCETKSVATFTFFEKTNLMLIEDCKTRENLEKRVRENAETMIKQAYYNALTGLPNRISLMSDLGKHLGDVIILINVNDFTTINDFYGYKVGDTILKQIANVLQEFAKEHAAKVYKLPSDEFALLLQIDNHASLIEQYLQKIKELVESSDYFYEDAEIYIGITQAAAVVNIEKTGLIHADMTLKLAKQKRKEYLVYHEDMQLSQQYEHNIKMAHTIKRALKDDNVIPFYQPIIDLSDMSIAKYEALIRIKEEDKILPPFIFLDISRKIRLYGELTKRMIEKSFAFFANTTKRFSLNLSFEDISNEHIKNFLLDKLQQYGVGSQLTIELLETEEIEDVQIVHDFVNMVRRYGVKVAIDDFGSGYANFEYVTNIASDFVKIDGSLIKNIDKDRNSKIITETIVAFTKKMGKKTVAEFVHSKEVLEVVQQIGIDYAQGHYFSESKESI